MEVNCLDSDGPSGSVYAVYVWQVDSCQQNDRRGKKVPRPKKGANFRRAELSHMSISPRSTSTLSFLLSTSSLSSHLPPYTTHPCHHEVSRAIDPFIPAKIYAGSHLSLNNGLLRAPFSALNAGTALIPSALLVAGVYAVKPEYLAYAVALAGIITTVAFFTGGSSMLHHLPPESELQPRLVPYVQKV